tara:strand:+ start:198 stop:728 length:531 start_codon:yes stop_codon:yes gene_type:complete
MELFGFAGKKGSGKNYIAQHLFLPFLKPKPSLIVAFADVFKLNGIVMDFLKREEVFGSNKSDYTREKLQQQGHENGRLKYGDDIWIEYMNEKILMYSDRGIERFLITDVRYNNELEWIKEQDGYTFLVMGNNIEHDIHASENGITSTEFIDYVIDNREHDKTLGKVTDIIKELEDD